MKRIYNSLSYRIVKKPFLDRYKSKLIQHFNGNYDGSIISHNCFGGDIYRDLDIEYLTPTAGLFIPIPGYIKLLQNLRSNLTEKEIRPLEKSRYYGSCKYPIGILDDDIEIHFLHYDSFDNAVDKWNRRAKRVNYKKLRILMSERDLCEEHHIQAFDSLSFEKKICFTKNKYPIHSTHFVEKYKNLPEFPGADVAKYDILKSFDLINWL